MTVDIVMATYNGEAYLEEQLESLISQDESNWRLIVRDDGSTDKTKDILRDYRQKYPDRIFLMEAPADKPQKPLGVSASFSALLTASSAPYVMCCDQDDVWHPQKISLSLQGMKELEQEYGETIPLLIHTDSTITDHALNVTAKSRMHYFRLGPEHGGLGRLLVQNHVQGCTLMVNRALLNAALPVPYAVRMYDMWLAQVASAIGHIGYIEQATVLYRQHRNNIVGAKKKSIRDRAMHIQTSMDDNVTQAILLLDKLGETLPEQNKKLLQVFSKLPDKGFFERRRMMVENKILRRPGWQNIPMLLMM